MLRARLFLNLIPVMVMLLAVGVFAIALFSRLANKVDVTVMENYRSNIAARNMDVAMSRMEEGLRLAIQGDTNSATAAFNDNTQVFATNLGVLVTNKHLFTETRLIEQLQSNYQMLSDAARRMLELSQESERRAIFDKDVVNRKLALGILLEQISKLNDKNILATTGNIQQINQRITHLMIAGVAVAFLISAFASFHLSKSILRPIQLLTKATREIGEGNLDQTVPVISHDELGELATAFNKMAAQLEVYRQNTSEKIIRLHRTMESALASFPDPIFILDREGRIELKNPAARELSGHLKLDDTLPPPLADTASNVLRTSQDFLPHSFKEVMSLRVDGEEKSFLPRILTMRGEQHVLVGVAVVLHDVTRFRLLDDAKTNLVATVSHELKTPLTSVRMVLHLLLEKNLGPLTSQQEELLQMARKDAERLLRILNDLLDLTRLEAGESGLHLERITPESLVQSIADEVRTRIVDQDLTLSCSVEPQLPAVLVDSQRIDHVFQNFIANAIKHSPPKGEIQVRAERNEDGGVQFSVIDHGPGVPEKYHSRIFERFFRVPGQSRSGAGLGLSIAREIAIAHGGRIGVHSKPGQGSEFYVVLASAEEETLAITSLSRS